MWTSSHYTLVQPSNNFFPFPQKCNEKQKQSLAFPKKLPIFIPFLSFQRGATEIISSVRDNAQCFKVCQHTAHHKTNRHAFLSFIYSFWPWCCLNQTLGYRCIWEQGVNLTETAVCGGLGGDGEERKGDASAHWKRELLRNKHQSPAHTESSQLARSAVHSNIITAEQHQAAFMLYSNQFTDELLHASTQLNTAFWIFSPVQLGLQGF